MTLLKTTHDNAPKRIFIDATYTLGSGKSSGIERVVRNVTRECEEMASGGELPVCRQVISHGGNFYAVGPDEIQGYQRTAAMHKNVLRMTPAVYRFFAALLCTVIPHKKLRKWFLPQPGHLGVFKLLHTILEARMHRRVSTQCSPIQPQENDLFLLPDAYWVNRLRNTVWPAASEARAHGAKVAAVIYDLIPLTHPEFVGEERSETFLDYVQLVASHTDLLVAISKTVRDQLIDFLESVPQPSKPFCTDIRWFDLGCEFHENSGTVRSSVRTVFDQPHAPYLMVATFDPRKNHNFLLDAFDTMWNAGDECQLCLVGRFGSQCDSTVERIQSHDQLGKKLFLFNDLSDAELQHCYRKARGVVFPSIVEGFGLPIVESLWFKKKTIVSDTKIHREVGKDDCSYFDLDDTGELIEAIRRWDQSISSGNDNLQIERELTSWRSSSEQIISHCLSLFDRDSAKAGAASKQAA